MDKDSGIVARVIGVLQAFADGESTIGIKQLSQRLDLPPSTLHRLLAQLVEIGLVERAPQRRYRIGTEFFRLSCRVERKFRVSELARPLMRAIAHKYGETCSLSIYVPSSRQRLLIAKVDSPVHNLRYTQPILENRSPVWGAAGRVILAHLPAQEVEKAYCEAPQTSPTGTPLPSIEGLMAELEKIRATGFAFARGELLSRATVAMAVPYFGQRGVKGGLCVVIPATRFKEIMAEPLSTDLLAAAHRLTLHLGGRTPTPVKVLRANGDPAAVLGRRRPGGEGDRRVWAVRPGGLRRQARAAP